MKKTTTDADMTCLYRIEGAYYKYCTENGFDRMEASKHLTRFLSFAKDKLKKITYKYHD